MYRILKKVYNLAFKETHLINFNKVFIIQLSQMNGKWEKTTVGGNGYRESLWESDKLAHRGSSSSSSFLAFFFCFATFSSRGTRVYKTLYSNKYDSMIKHSSFAI